MDNDLNNIPTLTELVSADVLQRLQDAFSDMTGMAALTTDNTGTPVTKGSNFTDFCMKFTRENPIGCSRCFDCDRMGAEMAMTSGEASVYYCHAGLVDFAAPIVANGVMVGSFIGGQVLTSPPNIDKFANNAKSMGIDEDEYIKAVLKVHIVEKSDVDRAAKFLYVTAGALSDIAYSGYKMYLNNIEIEKAARLKSDFLANMSHEIRTPMNAVLGMAEMALREEMSPAARDYLRQIRSSGKTLLVIINDILDFSKIESGKMDIIPVTYEPLSVINDVASIVCSRIGNADIEFTLDISGEIPHKLFGDNVRIQQILINLLNNAVKFTKHGCVHLKMDCVPDENDEGSIILRASVTDTGQGIRQEDMNKLFRSFQQVDSKRNRNMEGTGLGLAISKQLLSLMNGKISVESEYNKGSTFSLELPQKMVTDIPPLPQPKKALKVALLVGNPYLRQQLISDLEKVNACWYDAEGTPSLSENSTDFFIVERSLLDDRLIDFFRRNTDIRCIVIDEFGSTGSVGIPGVRIIRKPVYYLNLYQAMDISDGYAPEESSAAAEFSFTAPDAHVLIVDDNSINLTVAKGLMEPVNMQIDTAASAAETIELVKGKSYDIIFMDHMMPEVDGVETTHIIRRLIPGYEDVPIIALTANAIGGAKEMFIKEGMNDMLAKPIETKELIGKLRKWLPAEKIIPDSRHRESVCAEDVPVIGDLNVSQAMSLLGGKELYMSVLREYYKTIDKKSEAIERYCETGQLKNYTVEVHALKSTSRQIGAEELSGLAAELEKAGNEGNNDIIDAKTGNLLARYRSYKDVLAPLFPDEGAAGNKTPADDVLTMEMLEELTNALDAFDTLAIDDVIEKMSGYSYDSEYDPIFTRLKAAAEAGDVDECTLAVSQWKKNIAELYTQNF